MIWAFEYLNKNQIKELKSLNPLMDFEYDFLKRAYYWKTFCADFETIYQGNDPLINSKGIQYIDLPINQIEYYPNEKECIDNVPTVVNSYEYILDKIISGKFQWSLTDPIKVVYIDGKYHTIDKSRLKAFKDAYSLGYNEFEKIPARIVNNLAKEIRRIRLFSIEQVRQGFICDTWEEARTLSMYLQNVDTIKTEIENEYRWIKDYLSLRRQNIWIKIIAIPVSIYLEHYEKDDAALEKIDLQCLMKRY